jgi:DNA polymerase I-like protein with 3'-5' exonuclease and polymerase domains
MLMQAPLLACDSEHDGVTVKCVAFAATPEEAWTFVLPRDREAVAELLATPAEKVWMNAQSDLTVLKRAGFDVRGPQHDIMLLFHALEPLVAGRSGDGASGAGRKRLSFLASIYTNEPWWKDYGFQSEEDRWKLCATDTRVTLEVWEALWSRATTRKLQPK